MRGNTEGLSRSARELTGPAATLVGRERELDELRAALDGADAGRGSLFLVGGEAGAGKTRLVDAVSAWADDSGSALVLWGRCWEGGGAPAYWPWVQLVRSYARAEGAEAVAEGLGPAAGRLAELVPELGGQLAPAPEDAPAETEDARFAFFDSVTTFLHEAARKRPLLIVLDDLHAADEPSLLLLDFVARELRATPIVAIGTYRPAERGGRAGDLLGRLGREARIIALGGLDETAVERFVQDRTEQTPAPGLAKALLDATEGNPFFLDEVVRLLLAEGLIQRADLLAAGTLPIPEGVREAIRRRLEPLAADVLGVLESAAMLGKEFTLVTVDRICDLPRERLLEALAEAEARGLVMAVPGALGRYRFAHVLIRDVLYEDIGAVPRVDRHRQVGEALEEVYADELEPHLAELAHHFLQAAATGSAEKAVDYATRAGDHAMALLAFEEAAAHYGRALEALHLVEGSRPEERCELLLSLGEAERKSGETERAKGTFTRASEAARRLGDVERQARAALGFAGRYWTTGVVDADTVRMLEEALRAVGTEHEVLRARMLGRLSTELYYSRDRERAASLSAEAVETARRLDDPRVLAAVLDDRLSATWGPDNLDDRLALATEIVELADAAGDRETAVRGRALRATCLFELGEIARAEAEIDVATQLAEELRQPALLWHTRLLRCLRALAEGRFEDSERLAHEALLAGRRADEENALHLYSVQISGLRRAQGRLEELEEPTQRFVDRFPTLVAWRCVLALLYALLGRPADARREFEHAAGNDWNDLARDSTWLYAIANAADTCAALADTARAPRLYELLLPYAGRNVVLGRVATLTVGSASRYLGRLAWRMSRLDDAERHFEDALEANTRMGAVQWIGHTRYDLARMLLERGADGDEERAADLLAEALSDCERLGMERLAESIRSLGGERPEPEAAPAAAPQVYVFRKEGDYWKIGRERAPFTLRDVKGLSYLVELLRHPDTELHATQLVSAVEGAPPAAGRSGDDELTVGADDAGPALDAEAKAAYKERLESLREELEEAESFGDPERVASAREEMEFLAQELSAAVGLGGRDRKAASTSERARVNVTRAIKSAVQRIGENDPELSGYLDSTVRTGTFCSYSPDRRAPISWSL